MTTMNVAEFDAAAHDSMYPKSVLRKVNSILDAFSAGPTHLGLTDLSERSGVPKASVYRVAQELVHWGLLRRVGDGYQLGMRMFELGQRVPTTSAMRTAARPVLLDLYARTRATLHLAVPDGHHVLYIDKVAGRVALHANSEIGCRMPMFCTASGKVLLAHHGDLGSLLEHYRAVGLTPSISGGTRDIEELADELNAARRNGFASEQQEVVRGYGSVACPVTAGGNVVAAVSITVPVALSLDRALVSLVRSAAGAISRRVDELHGVEEF